MNMLWCVLTPQSPMLSTCMPSDFSWFLVWLNLQPWIWRCYVPLKRWLTFTKVHGYIPEDRTPDIHRYKGPQIWHCFHLYTTIFTGWFDMLTSGGQSSYHLFPQLPVTMISHVDLSL
jgi:hypothetical protein